MPCPADRYQGGRDDNCPWHNWLGNVSYVVQSYFEPSSRRDLVWILKEAEAQGKKVKAVGWGWSYEDCAASEDWVVDIKRLSNTITFLTDPATGPALLAPAWAARQFGASAEKLCHVEAGIRIIQLNQRLEREGLAMLTLGGSQGQTLAGATSTSTHGSDLDQPPLPGVIQAVHLVTTGGQEVWIESDSKPVTADDVALRSSLRCSDLRIFRDDELLRAAMVTVGRFGVIYAYVLKVTALYRLSDWTEELTWSSVSDALAAGTGLGHDIPVRRHLGGLPGLLSDPPAGLGISTAVSNFRFLDILINPNLRARHGDEVCWVRRRWLTDNADPLNLEASENPLCHKGTAIVLLTVVQAALSAYAGEVLSIPFYGIGKSIEIATHVTRLNVLAHDPHLTGGEALAATLEAIWGSQIHHALEWLVAEANHIVLAHQLGKSRDEGMRGPGWQVLAGLTEGTTGECYRANSVEVIFNTETRAYIDFIDRLLDHANEFHIGGYISIRFSSHTDACLSMHNVKTPLAVSIEVTSLYGLEDSNNWIAFAERTAKEMGGRPHWGQQNRLSALDVLALYDLEELQTWWHQCFQMVGRSSTTFSNNYTRQRGLEPMRRPVSAYGRVSPPLLDLGRVLKGAVARRDRSLTVANVGKGTLVIQSIRTLGAQATAFSITPDLPAGLPVSLQPGEAFAVSVRFQSASVGKYTARMEITSLDRRSDTQMTFEAVLLANVVAPDMHVLPAAINFGPVMVGRLIVRNVLVTNDGSAALSFRVNQPSQQQFQWTGDDPDRWRSLPPGGSAVIAVRYKPVIAGAHSGKVVIRSNDETVIVLLYGQGTPSPLPEIHAIPRQFSFGSVHVGTASMARLILANDSSAPLRISGARIDGPDAALFGLPGPIPTMIQAGRTAYLTVSFTPVAMVDGGHHARLVVESNASNDPQLAVSLAGTGAASSLLVMPSQIAFNPSPLAPALPPGQGSRRGLDIYSVGAGSLLIAGSSFRVLEARGGQLSPHFEIVDAVGRSFPQDDLQLGSGAFQHLSVQFRPVTAGDHSGRIEITFRDSLQAPTVVYITGRGVA